MQRKIVALAVAMGLTGLSPVAGATDPAALEALRAEVATMKQQYEQRIAELEARLNRAEAHNRDAMVGAAPPVAHRPSPSFSPEISLILDGKWSAFQHDPEDYRIPGFSLPPHTTPGTRGPSLGHSELRISGNIDPWFRGAFTAAFHDDHEGGHGAEIAVEEAWMETLALGEGFNLRAGRFFSGIGYANEQHPHEWDFADNSLPYRAMLGNENYSDDGLRLSWVAPTDTFINLGGELLRGRAFPADPAGNGAGAWSLFGRVGGDVGRSHAWQAGLSWLGYKAQDRTSAGHGHDDQGHEDEEHGGGHVHHLADLPFTGDGDLYIASLVWKWAPDGDDTHTAFKLQGEYFWRKEKGDLELHERLVDYTGRDQGWYLQGVYKFLPRWRVGLRYDGLSADNQTGNGHLQEHFAYGNDFDPHRWSAMVDWTPSEYSRIRLQYNRDNSTPWTDNQWFLQYIMSLGAHGAHRF